MNCPDCNAVDSMTTEWVSETFLYGPAHAAAKLSVTIPVRRCSECNFRFTDGKTEDLKRQAIKKHLAKRTPLKPIRDLEE